MEPQQGVCGRVAHQAFGLGRAGSVYCMTKGGLVSLTRELAAEWGSSGVRVNALAPGWIRTPMTEALQNNSERSARVMARAPNASM